MSVLLCLADVVSFDSAIPSVSYNPSASSPTQLSEPGGQGVLKTSHRGPSAPKPLTLCTLSSYGCQISDRLILY